MKSVYVVTTKSSIDSAALTLNRKSLSHVRVIIDRPYCANGDQSEASGFMYECILTLPGR